MCVLLEYFFFIVLEPRVNVGIEVIERYVTQQKRCLSVVIIGLSSTTHASWWLHFTFTFLLIIVSTQALCNSKNTG